MTVTPAHLDHVASLMLVHVACQSFTYFLHSCMSFFRHQSALSNDETTARLDFSLAVIPKFAWERVPSALHNNLSLPWPGNKLLAQAVAQQLLCQGMLHKCVCAIALIS